MVISKHSDIAVCSTLCKGEEERLKHIITFEHLSYKANPGARCDTEIKKIIALCKDTFTKIKSILNNKKYQN